MAYREYPPHPALAAHVACLWTMQVAGSPGTPRVHRVLPDNCVDILWQDSGMPAFAVGMMSVSVQVPASRPMRTVAVRFKPGAAGLFLGVPLHGLTDIRADLADLWGRPEAGRLEDALWDDARDEGARLALIQRALLRRLRENDDHQPAGLGLRAVAALEASHGALRVEALADALHVSRQHLALQFRQQVGLSPKLFARICRFRRALALLREPAGHGGDLAMLAAECGYFDQSHLIRDFRDFADGTPGGL